MSDNGRMTQPALAPRSPLAGVVAVVVIALVVDLLLVVLGRLLMPWLPRRGGVLTRRAPVMAGATG